MKKVFIIAEAGVNHNGSLELALKLCDEAKWAGADAVKFQTFITEKIITKGAKLASYQEGGDHQGQFELVKRLELKQGDFIKISEHCRSIGIEFMSTPDEEESLEFLVGMGMRRLKVGSGEMDNVPFLRRIAGHNLPTIFSTGMSSLAEVEKLFETVSSAGLDREKMVFLHCNTEYPTPYADVNMRAMLTIKERINVDVGYSDHTIGHLVPCVAVSMGAVCIEKHLTLDNSMPGPDHKASMNPEDFRHMVDRIREVETILGSAEKKITPSESKNRPIVRKVIVASRSIREGEVFNEHNLCLKRAGQGISGLSWDKIQGKIARNDYAEDQVIREEL